MASSVGKDHTQKEAVYQGLYTLSFLQLFLRRPEKNYKFNFYNNYNRFRCPNIRGWEVECIRISI